MMNQSCKQFRKVLQNECVAILGAYNGLTGRILSQKGGKCAYISGAAISGSKGVPDIGLTTLPEFTQIIREVHMASGLPVLADADTGFGEGEMCARTVVDYYLAGAAGLHIEDQVFPKRCGHLDGKALITVDHMVSKIKIMRQASLEVSAGEFIVCARTDARGTHGLDETIARSKCYIDAGADMIFPEGLTSQQEFREVAKALKEYSPKTYLLANMTEFGKTPIIQLKEFEAMGYNCVIYPVTTLRVAMKAIEQAVETVLTQGSQQQCVEDMYTRQQLYQLLGYTPGQEWYYPSPTKQNK